MTIKYIGRVTRKCEMCNGYSNYMYLDDNKMVKGLFPEVNWKDLHICEKCAKREVGNKAWKKIKRNLK